MVDLSYSPSTPSLTMKTKAKYKVRNWKAYDAALKQRGSITFWVSEEVIEQWRNEKKTGLPGASNYYSDVAIATMGTIQSVFHLPGRQTEGFLESLFTVMGVEARSAGSLNPIPSFEQVVSGTAFRTKR